MQKPFVLLIGLLVIAGAAVANYRARLRRAEREHFIRAYVFPRSVLQTLSRHHPHLQEKDHFLVARALREYFIVRVRAGKQLIGMPSKVTDDLWHEFILHTREYERFCRAAFGSFFHHVPAAATPKGQNINGAMHVTWRLACLEENINPAQAPRLPLLFAIDEKLSISGGHRYSTRQWQAANPTSDGCAGVACGGAGDAGHGGSCSGHGCGGHGCGGGCGGGD